MSEETQAPGSGAETARAPDAAALALCLTGASRSNADAFLADQRAMLQLQMAEMRERNPYERSHLHWQRFTDRMKAALQVMTVLVGLAVAGALGTMVWKAAHAEGLVIESFTVPPELAARGLTGEVVAGRLLDRLKVVMTPGSNSASLAQAASTSSSDDVKVEIPETGISLGELYRFLRRWLGHENMISGEVVRDAGGITITARVNGRDGASYAGTEAAFDDLVQKAAEHVAEVNEPTRYAGGLGQEANPRIAQAQAIYQRVLADPMATPYLKASAWNGLANMSGITGDVRMSTALYRRARETDPTFALGFTNGIGTEEEVGHAEAAFALLPQAIRAFEKGHDHYLPVAATAARVTLQSRDARYRGDYARSLAIETAAMAVLNGGDRQGTNLVAIARDMARLHDGGTMAWLEQQLPLPAATPLGRPRQFRLLQIEVALQHWPAVITMADAAEKALPQSASTTETGRAVLSAIYLRPWAALAKAKLGDMAGAEAMIAATPGDCYHCIRIRGIIASEAKRWARADYWFARAVADAPSIPFAYEDWGRSLLDRGDADAAIAQFTASNRRGPHFADAIEGWGEALMAKNQSHLALAKFTEANKYAPNWGRLHLKWGLALAYAGKRDEAAKHFARAAALDLTPSEKSELARNTHR